MSDPHVLGNVTKKNVLSFIVKENGFKDKFDKLKMSQLEEEKGTAGAAGQAEEGEGRAGHGE